MKIIIFTDLDGTFLNHDDYCFSDSLKGVTKILNENIPLIFTTSKTKIEVETLHQKLKINEPFIIENGAALFIPKDYKELNFSFLEEYENYYICQLGLPYEKILEFYNKYKKEFGLLGFSDMNKWELMKYTKLDSQIACLAKQRNFTEPFILNDESKLNSLKEYASKYGIKITKGGRFYHLIGINQDKGKAVKKAIEVFEQVYNEKVKSIALGDGNNDIPMLENVDVPIIIKNHKGGYINCNIKNIQKSKYKGSTGWSEMVLKNV
ncbi:MAG: HAD-IIB family hydrolase [Erysipelotrichia bacterium]|nr:HAD-IIB family hydrolase [Erysipelotrichia bacterium]